jgi:uncharacterized protein involved in response to NO
MSTEDSSLESSSPRWLTAPLWLAGFRPFFTLAFVSGALLPLIWGLVFAGQWPLPASALPPLVWHAHEMFYGFGWAVLGGFLLTASKNWVGVRGIHGAPLALATLLWLVERVAILWGGALPLPVRLIVLNGSVLFVGGYVFVTLVRFRRQDSFRDNGFFLVALPLFLAAKSLLLNVETFATGTAMTLGLFRVAFVVMLERTMPQFMKNAMQVTLVRNRLLDGAIKVLALLCVFQASLPPLFAAALLALLGGLLLTRLVLWHPLVGLRTFGIGIMYVGSLGLIAHLFLEAARVSGALVPIGAVSLHTFTFLCMGIIIPGMLIRICQGHTGRKLLFTKSDRVALGVLAAGAFCRLVATQLWPVHYQRWIALSAMAWAICFLVIGVRLVPFLFQPRVDGRVH